jgi:hypothetical protein
LQTHQFYEMTKTEDMAADVAEPRDTEQEKQEPVGITSTAVKPQARRLHDPNVTFEEYYYYAQQTRAEEEQHPKTGNESRFWSVIWPSKADAKHADVDEKRNLSNPAVRSAVSDEEWANASRALRNATRGAIFYLITTDILGPFGLPYAFATTGWG